MAKYLIVLLVALLGASLYVGVLGLGQGAKEVIASGDVYQKVICGNTNDAAVRDLAKSNWGQYFDGGYQGLAQHSPKNVLVAILGGSTLVTEAQRVIASDVIHEYLDSEEFQASVGSDIERRQWVILCSFLDVISGKSLKLESLQYRQEELVDSINRGPELGRAVLPLIDGFDKDEDRIRVDSTILAFLNPFWHEDIRSTIDDSACPYYRGLVSPIRKMNQYAEAYFLALMITDIEDFVSSVDSLERLEDRLVGYKLASHFYTRQKTIFKRGKGTVVVSNATESYQKWVEQIQSRLDAATSDEEKYIWLQIRSYTEQINSYAPRALAGLEWEKKAIGLSVSEVLKQEALLNQIESYSALRDFDNASQLSEKVTTTDPAITERLEGNKQNIAYLRDLYAAEQKQQDYMRQYNEIVANLKVVRQQIKRIEKYDPTNEEGLKQLTKRLHELKAQLNHLEGPIR
ncbi:hypothetical protein JD969_06900 [Planctomycetota bacterium]|nr:hypothetical protein JD969_06900 [Planctomycetota bacterium]